MDMVETFRTKGVLGTGTVHYTPLEYLQWPVWDSTDAVSAVAAAELEAAAATAEYEGSSVVWATEDRWSSQFVAYDA